MGFLGKSAQKKQLGCIRVLGQSPSNAEAWKHVAEHLALSKYLRQLAVRWNAVASELHLDSVEETDPSGGVAAGESYSVSQGEAVGEPRTPHLPDDHFDLPRLALPHLLR